MKMVKSLLLGSAAGLVAITAGQAADLPVKAKPVEYVKICSLYGAGFYYMPGTDMCIKIGGWVRLQTHYNDNGNSTNGPLIGNTQSRATNDFGARARAYMTIDNREQTAYGTVRAYLDVGISTDVTDNTTPAPAFSSNRAFVQWAGMTIGLTQSFYDYYSQPAAQYYGWGGASDTGDAGQWVWGYTAQLGNGLALNLAAELARRTTVINASNLAATGIDTTLLTGALITNSYNGSQIPDFVASLRVDQTWGGAQIMGALHQVAAQYNTGTAGTGGDEGTGHPGNVVGWAAGAGLKLLFPMIAKGDWFQAQVNIAEGATKYIANSPGGASYAIFSGQSLGIGAYSDAVYTGATGGALNLTSIWGANASYEHFWDAAWHTSLWGAYNKTTYNTAANTALCTGVNAGGLAFSGGVASCNMDFSVWAVGSRTQWNITPDFYMGVEVLYTELNQKQTGTGTLGAAVGPYPAGSVLQLKDQGAWGAYYRVEKDFLP